MYKQQSKEWALHGLQQVNHPWNLDTSPSVCFIFKHTTPHWKKPTKAGNTYIVFCPPHGKDDTGNYILPVYLLRKDLHYHSLKYLPLHLLLGGLPGPWPSKLPFTSFSSVTSSISSSLKRPFTPYAEKSTPLKSHNMPLPRIKPVTPPSPMRSITSPPPELPSVTFSKQPHSSPKRSIRPSTSSSAKRLHSTLWILHSNQQITQGIWILHHHSPCVPFSNTLNHIRKKKTSLQQTLVIPMLFHAPHDKDDAENSSVTPYSLPEHNTDQELPSHMQRTYYHPGGINFAIKGKCKFKVTGFASKGVKQGVHWKPTYYLWQTKLIDLKTSLLVQ